LIHVIFHLLPRAQILQKFVTSYLTRNNILGY